jgi:hypothetical protein
MASTAAGWRAAGKEAEVRCPQCGQVLQAGGEQQRALQTPGGARNRVETAVRGLSGVWAGLFFSLDEELGLLPGSLTPHAAPNIPRQGAWLPFGRAAELLAGCLRVQVSEATARCYTEAAGATCQVTDEYSCQVPGPADPGVGRV